MTTLLQPLPFYTTNDDLYHKRTSCRDECFFELHSPNQSLLPFMIKRPTSPNPVNSFKVQCQDGSSPIVLDPALIVIACTIIEDGEKFDLLTYDGSDIGETIPCGFKQIEVSDLDTVFLSELFFVGDFTKDNSPYYKYIYSDTCGVKDVPYNDDDLTGFEFYMFFNKDVEWGVPVYTHEITDSSDGLGRSLIESQRIEKIFTLETGFVPEYLIDALSFSLLHESKELQERNGIERIKLLELELSQEPDPDGCYHESTLTFKLEKDLVKGSCCDVIEKPTCFSQSSVINVEDRVDPDQQAAIEGGTPAIGQSWFIQKNPLVCPSGTWCDHQNEIATWNGVEWDFTVLEEFDVFWDIPLGKFFMLKGTVSVQIPLITSVDLGSAPFVEANDLIADIHPCYFGRIEFSYDGGSTYDEIFGYFTYDELQSGIDDVVAKDPDPTHFQLVMYSHTCPDIVGNEIAVPV